MPRLIRHPRSFLLFLIFASQFFASASPIATVTVTETYTLLIETILVQPTTVFVNQCLAASTSITTVYPSQFSKSASSSSQLPSSITLTSSAPGTSITTVYPSQVSKSASSYSQRSSSSSIKSSGTVSSSQPLKSLSTTSVQRSSSSSSGLSPTGHPSSSAPKYSGSRSLSSSARSSAATSIVSTSSYPGQSSSSGASRSASPTGLSHSQSGTQLSQSGSTTRTSAISTVSIWSSSKSIPLSSSVSLSSASSRSSVSSAGLSSQRSSSTTSRASSISSGAPMISTSSSSQRLSPSSSFAASSISSSPSACPTFTPTGNRESYKLSTNLPGIPFPIPQSYAGDLSINASNLNDDKKYYFFYTVADQAASQDDIIFWFNGGPGCSSLEGAFQENGPFLLPYYQPGQQVQPILNTFGNNKAAHAVWVEQPGSTGFSTAGFGVPGLRAIATDFKGFITNFFLTFPELRGKRMWLQGESFAGAMIPYMADAIYQDNTLLCKGINLKGIQINDPSWANNNLMQQLVIYPYAVRNQVDLTINSTQLADYQQKAAVYGLDTYYDKHMKYPPNGQFTLPPGWNPSVYDIYDDIQAAWDGAHCSSVYNIHHVCSDALQDPLGYPLNAGLSYTNFINNVTGLKEAIHANPNVTWGECTGGVYTDIGELPPADSVMPNVIERSERVIIGGGDYDILLMTLGSALAIQNMTWAGAQGFQYGVKKNLTTSQGVRGVSTTERGLSLVEFFYAGHMIPQDDGEAAFKATQFLIGSIPSL